jgi:UDP-N-acetyl-D-galactosamine dehydrogenase
LNIALVNELAIIFNKLDIDTQAVLEAAGTKWNFLPFRPGLVGGHCIGVDPYYLTHKAQQIGYHPEVILAGRRINDGMGKYVVSQLIKAMIQKGISVVGSKVLVMGLTFKENCPDLRNTRVVDIVYELQDYGVEVDIYDPWVNPKESFNEYQLTPFTALSQLHDNYDSILIAVAHTQFKELGIQAIRNLGKTAHILYDLKASFSPEKSDVRL